MGQFAPSGGRPPTPGTMRTRSDVHDQHAPGLLHMARAICQDDETSSSAVERAFEAAFTDSPGAGENPRISHLLARLTYLACTLMSPVPKDPPVEDLASEGSVSDARQRALLALTTYGDHTCDEAAALLHIDLDTAATVLHTMLLAPETTGPSTCVTVRPGEGHDVVALTGELDLATIPQLSPVIHGLLAEGRNSITIDLDAVTFMDAIALNALVLAHRDVGRSHGSLAITQNPLCARLLAITGLASLFDAPA